MSKEKIDLKKVKPENIRIRFRPAVTPASNTLAVINRLARKPEVLISILKAAKPFDEDEYANSP